MLHLFTLSSKIWSVLSMTNPKQNNQSVTKGMDILLTHSPYEWCKKHNKMELLMSCENAQIMIKKEIEKLG